MRTVKEISSGGVVYRKRQGVLEVALILARRRWRLPKGQVEEGEGLEETALREVREETGLEGKVVEKLGDITYWYTNKTHDGETIRIFKRVYFYLVRYLSGDIARHDAEVEDVRWWPIEQARKRLFYPTERKMMRQVIARLADGRLKKPGARIERAGKRTRDDGVV
jgi:8-oxo-dGTP pyrophosphatase MutT (NUDIX family)